MRFWSGSGAAKVAALLSLLVLSFVEALDAQGMGGCHLGPQAGVLVPVNRPPFGSRENLDLDVGGGGAVKLTCRPKNTVQLGVGLEGNYMEPLFVGHLLGFVGARLMFSGQPRSAWLGISVGAGLTTTAQLGTLPLTLPTGVAVKLDGVGIGFGGDVLLGVPMSDKTSFFVTAGLRWSLLPTERLPEGDDAGLTSLGYVPISVGYEFAL